MAAKDKKIEDALDERFGPDTELFHINLDVPAIQVPAHERHWRPDYVAYGKILTKAAQIGTNLVHSVSAKEAALAIDALTPSATRARQIEDQDGDLVVRISPESHLRYLWQYFDVVVRQLPPDWLGQDKMVTMLAELINLPGSMYFTVGDEMYNLWSDLPLLNESIKQRWHIPTRSDELFPDRYEHYVSKNAFFARLFARGAEINLPRGLHTTLLTLAIAALRTALEETIEPYHHTGGRGASDPQVRSAHLLGAAQWVFHAAPHLLDEAKRPALRREDRLGFEAATAPGRAYGGLAGIQLPRWMWWKEVFFYFHGALALGPAVKEAMKRAADTMECLEARDWLVDGNQVTMLIKARVDMVNGRMVHRPGV